MLAYMVVKTCEGLKPSLPGDVIRKMRMNVMIVAIGFVPFIGDIADVWYKCNTRNAILLESELRKRGQNQLRNADRKERGKEHKPSPCKIIGGLRRLDMI
jgi:Domain of unknown function (DUF4112)